MFGWLRGLFSRSPTTTSPKPEAAPKKAAFKIPEALCRAPPTVSLAQVFSLPKHPPGVAPAKPSGMAMDDNGGINANLAWAAAGLGGVWTEGITFLGYAYLSELAQRPEYRVMSETIATEMTRKWIKFTSSGEDAAKAERIKNIEAEFTRLNVRDMFCRAATQDGFFGRGHIYIDTGDTDKAPELATSLGDGWDDVSKAKIGPGAIKALRTVEAVWVYPTSYNSNDPLRDDWYRPASWYVQTKIVHSSRMLTFIGREVPDLLKPTYSFGGLSLSQMAKPYVDNWLKTRQGVNDIINAFSVFVLMTNLQESLQGDGQQLFQRANLFNQVRTNSGLMMLDKDSEEFTNVAAPLSGLEGLQAQAQEHMCLQKGTLVETARGQVPIEEITPSDSVMTRQGFAPVKWAGMTGYASEFIEFSDDSSMLTVTETHPVWSCSINEFVSAKSVGHSPRLLKSSAWEFTASPSLGGGGCGARRLLATTGIRKLAASYIDAFMKPMSVLSQKVSTSIISMATNLITAFQTSRFYPGLNTWPSISASGSISLMASSRRNASFATPFLKQSLGSRGRRSTVRADADVQHTVSAAAGRRIRADLQPVYNLSVEDGFAPEFFANGFLVHNCAVAHIPKIKLLGLDPAGLNASTDGEMRAFYDYVHAFQEHLFRDKLHRLLGLVMLSLWGKTDNEIGFEFEPLWSLDEKALADVQKTKAETAQILIDTGQLAPAEGRTKLAADPDSGFDTIDVDDVPDLLEEEEAGLEIEGGRPELQSEEIEAKESSAA